MGFVRLRELSNALIARKAIVRAAYANLMSLTAEFDGSALERASAALGEETWDGEEGYDLEEALERLEGTPRRMGAVVPMFSDEYLAVFVPGRTNRSNILYALGETARLVRDDPDADQNKEEPNFSGWSPDEIRAAAGMLRNRVTGLTTDLRDINTWSKNLERASVSERAPSGLFQAGAPPEKGGWTRVPVLGAERLSRSLPAAAVKAVRSSLDAIAAASAPLEGEPATLDHWSSNASNRIAVDMPDPAAAFRATPR